MSCCVGPLGEYSDHYGESSECDNCGADLRIDKVRAYANELLTWHRNDASIATAQVAKDILYLIGEDK